MIDEDGREFADWDNDGFGIYDVIDTDNSGDSTGDSDDSRDYDDNDMDNGDEEDPTYDDLYGDLIDPYDQGEPDDNPDDDDQYPDDSDNTGAVDPPTPDVPTEKTWYKDNDFDKYVNKDETPIKSDIQPGPEYIEISSNKGYDCDDTNPLIGNCVIETKNCDTAASTRATNAKTLLNDAGLASSLAKFRDKTNLTKDKAESGLSIEKKADGTLTPYNEQMGTVSNVEVKTKETGKTLVAGVHTHVEGKEDGPSPQDIYHLIEGYKDNPNYTMDFNIAANGNEYALVVENAIDLLSYQIDYPSSLHINSSTNNFSVTNISRHHNLSKLFKDLNDGFHSQGFSNADVHEMAMVMLLDNLGIGVKLLKKENGSAEFKELSADYIKDATGKNIGFTVKKCN